jgi:hypothetical protein
VAPASGSRIKTPGAFTITNAGEQPLTWAATVGNGYKLSSGGGTLAPNQSVSVSVTPPTVTGAAPQPGTISVTSNGGSAALTAY